MLSNVAYNLEKIQVISSSMTLSLNTLSNFTRLTSLTVNGFFNTSSIFLPNLTSLNLCIFLVDLTVYTESTCIL